MKHIESEWNLGLDLSLKAAMSFYTMLVFFHAGEGETGEVDGHSGERDMTAPCDMDI